MSRPVSSPNNISINRDHAIDQDALNNLKNFKKGLGRNDRVLISNSGNTSIYTKHRESVSEKFIRKLNNFEKNVKAAWSHVSDLFSVKNQGNNSEEIKNIKDTLATKSPALESSSISVKKFNSSITQLTNTCIIPVLDELNEHRNDLKNLASIINKINLSYALDCFSTGSQGIGKVEKEFLAFLNFASAQSQGKPVTHPNRDAIDFAKRWTTIPYGSDERYNLKARFGTSYPIIDNTAVALAAFDKG